MTDAYIKSLSIRWVDAEMHAWKCRIENITDLPSPCKALSDSELEYLYQWVNEFMDQEIQLLESNGRPFPRGAAIANLVKALELPDEGASGREFLLRYELIHNADVFAQKNEVNDE